MDIAAILAQAALQAKAASDAKNGIKGSPEVKADEGSPVTSEATNVVVEPPTATPTELCLCGHEQHESDCEVEGCDCIAAAPQPSTLTVVIPPTPEVPIQQIIDQNSGHGTKDLSEIPDHACHHMCEKCQNWFSHGDKAKCRYPDLIKYGLCMECLNGGTNPDPLDDVEEDERGRKNLTPAAQVKIRNDEREICKDMSIEQISNHIEFTVRRELELRARGMEQRKIRAELIEEQVQQIPEEERDKFRAALLAGKVEKKPKKEKKETDAQKINRLTLQLQSEGCQMANLVAKWMVKTGKTRAEVEAMLND